MATFGQLRLTDLGIQAQANLQRGVPLVFTKIGIGSGEHFGSVASLKKLIKEEVSVDISKAYINDNKYIVAGNFTNENLQTGFEWREIGLYFEGEDGKDVLYCYANAGDKYDYIPATTDERYTKTVRITTAISNAANVSIKEPSMIYVEREEFEEYKSKVSTEISVERARIDLFTSLAEGSTTGDAELMDGRVDYKGNTHTNIGEHIRTVSTKLSDKIDGVFSELKDRVIKTTGKNLYDKHAIEEGIFYNYNTGIAKAESGFNSSELIEVESGGNYWIQNCGSNCHVTYWYNGEYVSGENNTSSSFGITIPDNANGIRFIVTDAHIDDCMFSKATKEQPYEDYKEAYRLNNDRIKIVSADGMYGYQTLSDAVDEAVDGDVIYVMRGTYTKEIVRAFEKDITIIGESPLNTIIKNTYSSYDKPPIEFSKGVLKNLTFYAEYDGTETTDMNGRYAYAMHCDNANMADGTLYVENCVFHSDKNAGLGVGMWGGWNGVFKNCRFISNANAPIYNHDCVNDDYLGEQKVSYIDCVFENRNNVRPLWLQSYCMEGSTVYYEFIRNVFSVTGGDPFPKYENTNRGGAKTVGTFNGMINCYKTGTSYLNTISSLNN